MPQPPQSLRETDVSTHPPAQRLMGGGQPHSPLPHTAPPVHETAQLPQLPGSFVKSTQAPLHRAREERHVLVHWPTLHT
jgi:hypothetical protein